MRAVSDRSGFTTLYASADSRHDQGSTIVSEVANPSRFGDEQILKFIVETETLDEFCARHALRPGFLKIDVEGAENLVLAGAPRLIQEDRPAVYFECGMDKGITHPHIAMFREHDYTLYCPDIVYFRRRWLTMDGPAHRRLVVEADPAFVEAVLLEPGGALTNLVAVPNENVRPFAAAVDEVEVAHFFEIVDRFAEALA